VVAAGGVPELSTFDCSARYWAAPPFPRVSFYSDLIEKDKTVPLDASASYQRYYSDMSRVFYPGRPDAGLRKDYEIGHGFKRRMLETIRIGMTVEELFAELKEAKETSGYPGAYCFHCIGLAVHDRPSFFVPSKLRLHEDDKSIVLPENVTFNAEVHSWRSTDDGRGGMWEEDTYLLTKDGPRRIGSLPDEMLTY